jgi:hypothetical protein
MQSALYFLKLHKTENENHCYDFRNLWKTSFFGLRELLVYAWIHLHGSWETGSVDGLKQAN